MSTQKSVQTAAGQHVNLVSGQSTHIATGKSLLASVSEKISLFVQNAGMKLFAAKGKVEIQAQSDNIEVIAQKSLKLISATEKVEVVAKQDILLTSGGAYIRIRDGNIEIHAPGKIDIKGSSHAFAGPTSLSSKPPTLPSGEGPYNEQFKIHDKHTGDPASYVRYRVETAEGKVFEGMTDEQGLTSRIMTSAPSALKVFLDT
jgi:type VI secretion system secreted protein VgrG